MTKRIFIICCLLVSIAAISFAQQAAVANPFSKMRFLNGPVDTLTLVANYSGIKHDIGLNNKSIVATIKKHGGKAIKGLSYSIDLKFENYRLLNVACNDRSMYNFLVNNTDKNVKLSIKCIVFRFYFFDGVCNFFYINKVKLMDKHNLLAKNL